MIIISQKITFSRERKPSDKINEKLQWFGRSLGLFSPRDKDGSCFRIFIELLKMSKQHKFLSSDELAYKLGLTRGTVVHHLNRLMEAGIIVTEKNGYMMRSSNLENLVEDIENDLVSLMGSLKKVAKDIDKEI